MPDKRQEGGHDRESSGLRFARKLRLAFGFMLLATLALAWYFYDTVEWYERDVQSIALGNQVLQNYQSLANQTWRLLNDVQEAVSAGAGADPAEWRRAADALAETANAIRRDITEHAALGEEGGATDQLQRLADVERVLGQLLAVQDAIAQALTSGEAEAASEALRRLHDEGLVALFARMTESIIADQAEAVRRSQGGAIDLAGYITGLLPGLMMVLTVFTVIMVWLFSRGLAEHRASLDEARVRLEAVVEERTRALKQSNEKLAGIDDNRRQLLADISHEFRTPLTVIQGEAEIALRGKGKKIAEYRDSLQRILEQAQQTTRLVDDLLFIARAEVGEPRLDLGEAPVAELLESVCEDFAARAKGKGIALELKPANGAPVVFGDAGRLRQVFSILLDNALKYSGEGGSVEVGLENGADAVTVTVSDRGIGLSEEDLTRVFERYYRSKRAAGHESGTGLGLPVAKAIVEAHGGEISLESRTGGGIVSTVRLPLAPREGASA